MRRRAQEPRRRGTVSSKRRKGFLRAAELSEQAQEWGKGFPGPGEESRPSPLEGGVLNWPLQKELGSCEKYIRGEMILDDLEV